MKIYDPSQPEKLGHNEVSFEELKQAAIDFLFTFEKPENFIDKGGVGRVYELMPGRCIKILDERHTSPYKDKFDLGNNPKTESMLLNKIANTKYGGTTRAPHFYGVITSEHEGERNAIIMERLNAINLQHVLNQTEQLPETFDLNTFFAELELFLEHMHTVEKIVHNDLYARNIMVDSKTGEPRIIDFGRSVDLNHVPDVETRKAYIDADWKLLDEIYEQLISLQK